MLRPLFFLFLLSASLLPANEVAAPAAAATDFIRVERGEQQVALQTAVTRYTKGEVQVDLIGAVHVADTAYYKKLNKVFENYTILLFEMIGGEHLGNGNAMPQHKGKHQGELGFLNSAFGAMQSMLGLSSQKDHIDYSAKNFIHADLTLAEFTALQKKRKESLLSFAVQSSLQADPKKQPSTLAFAIALLSRDSNKLKLQFIDSLADGDDQVGKLAGENVIIVDRNLKCLAVMDQHIELGIKNIGIFYGAAHFPDMEKRLIEKGFEQTKHTWINAWVVKK